MRKPNAVSHHAASGRTARKDTYRRFPRYVRGLLDKGSLWLMMYIVTLGLFWWESGSLAKGLIYGVIAATLKSFVALGHRCFVGPWLDVPH